MLKVHSRQGRRILVRQPTMADIARRAGVSRITVSYALNGRPGVSDALREQIRPPSRWRCSAAS
jgi:hypothetical protein